jgi:hypothetical protein
MSFLSFEKSKSKHSTGKTGYIYIDRFLLFNNKELLKKSELINNGFYVNKWDREKSEGCEIKGKANYKKKRRKREMRMISSHRIDEKNYWFDRKRKWVTAHVVYIERKDKSSLTERRSHALRKEKLVLLYSKQGNTDIFYQWKDFEC